MNLLTLQPRDRARVERFIHEIVRRGLRRGEERGYGSPLRVYRVVARLSQKELAMLARVSQQAIAFYENGRMRPEPAVRRRIARALRDATGTDLRPEHLFPQEKRKR